MPTGLVMIESSWALYTEALSLVTTVLALPSWSMRPVMAFARSRSPQRTGELCLRSTTDTYYVPQEAVRSLGEDTVVSL